MKHEGGAMWRWALWYGGMIAVGCGQRVSPTVDAAGDSRDVIGLDIAPPDVSRADASPDEREAEAPDHASDVAMEPADTRDAAADAGADVTDVCMADGSSDPLHCGAACSACPTGAHADAVCVLGA